MTLYFYDERSRREYVGEETERTTYRVGRLGKATDLVLSHEEQAVEELYA